MLKKEYQKTIKNEIKFSGKALQTGVQVEVICRPQMADSGIVFARKDLGPGEPMRIGAALISESGERRSSVGFGPAAIQTVEHFLAALWGAGIDNILVEVYGEELPGLDGSALEFYNLIQEAGTEILDIEKKTVKIISPITVEEGGASLTIEPSEGLSVSYFIDYDCPAIGKEEFDIDLNIESFEKEIVPARTFCLKKEAEALLAAGLGKGATYENTLVMDKDGPIGTSLRFPNEPVRHKILDLVGDLYMLGISVEGRIRASKSGHKLNAKLVKEIYRQYIAGK